ncbi:MAG: extracellular solute-binding protein [Oculatellaceae cyanobacterium bins.114]|nr:extracellular solute-binding protein [Oculatellaceae cyanobacterium bins.114]
MTRYHDDAERHIAKLTASLLRRRSFLKWCAAFGTGTLITQVASCAQPTSTNADGGASPAASESAAATGELPITIPLEELAAKAKEEGELRAYGMPPGWANWEGCFAMLEEMYGVKATYEPEGGLSSAEEIQKFLAEVNNPIGDIADVGILFGPEAKSKGATAAYKVSRWADIPDNLKDPDGHWASNYGGVLAFAINPDKAGSVPKSWAELRAGSFANMVAINGDPRQSNSALLAVIAAAYGNGGSIDDIEKGVDLFAELKQKGSFTPAKADTAGLQSGEVGIAIKPDFLALTDRDTFAGNPAIDVVIPTDGAVATNYAQIINKVAPHPYAARLFQEFIFSDEGQLAMLKGYVRPTLIDKLTIPDDLKAKLPDPAQYANVIPAITDTVKLEAAKAIVTEQWGPKVLGQ